MIDCGESLERCLLAIDGKLNLGKGANRASILRGGSLWSNEDTIALEAGFTSYSWIRS